MRILLVTEDLPARAPGGAALHAAVLGNALLDAGHEVQLLGYRQAAGSDDWAGFRGPCHTGIDFSGARWQENRLGVFMPMARPHMARRLWQAVQALPGPWDVVHYHGHNPLLGTRVPAGWNFVHTLHDQGAECITKMRFRDGAPCRETRAEACAACATPRPNALQRWLSVRAVRGLREGSLQAFTQHRVIFVSEFLRRRYAEVLGIAPAALRSQVVHNFVDAGRRQRALQRPPADWPAAGRLRVFAAGRIDAAKGFAGLLDALDDEMLQQRIHLTIAGGGPDVVALQAKHEPRGVRWLGWCEPEDVLPWVRAADVCVVPSVCEEACATAVLEALTMGCPVLALARGGTPELAVYGAADQLQLFDESRALAAALRSLAPQPAAPNDRATVQQRLPALLSAYALENT